MAFILIIYLLIIQKLIYTLPIKQQLINYDQTRYDNLVKEIFNTDIVQNTNIKRMVREEIATEEDCFGGVCVPFYLCHNSTIVTDGTGFIDDRFGGAKSVTCSRSMEICCNIDKIKLHNVHNPSGNRLEYIALIESQQQQQQQLQQHYPFQQQLQQQLQQPQQQQQHHQHQYHLQEEQLQHKFENKESTINYNQNNCGYNKFINNPNENYVIDGKTKYGEFPWMIIILVKLSSETYQYQCGGSLIHPSIALTAGHCIANMNATLLKIRAGEWDTQNKNQSLYSHQDRSVFKIIVHENYDRGSLKNDIGLLFLEQPIELNENINTICLPPYNYNFNDMNCMVSGWGKDNLHGKYNRILRKINLPILPRQNCQTLLRNTRLGRFFTLDESFLCAGGEQGRDTCKGDGGSPLVCTIPTNSMIPPSSSSTTLSLASSSSSSQRKKRFYQAGIVSWGIGCGQLDIPAVYVNVAMFRQWIDYYINKVNMYSGLHHNYN